MRCEDDHDGGWAGQSGANKIDEKGYGGTLLRGICQTLDNAPYNRSHGPEMVGSSREVRKDGEA